MKEKAKTITKEEFFEFIENESVEFLKKNANHGDIVVLNDNLLEESFYYFDTLHQFALVPINKKPFEVYFSSEEVTKKLLNKHSFSIFKKDSFFISSESDGIILKEDFYLSVKYLKIG